MTHRLIAALSLGLSFAIMASGVQAADGQAVYTANCAACHQPDGAGAAGLAPPLAGTLGGRLAFPQGRRYIAGVLMSGMAGKIESKGVVYNGMMPTWAALADDELAAVANYVVETFNKAETPADHKAFGADDFASIRNAKPAGKELKTWRVETEGGKK